MFKQTFVKRKPSARRRDYNKSLQTDIGLWWTQAGKEQHIRKCGSKIFFLFPHQNKFKIPLR